MHSTADPWTTQGLGAPTLCVVENLCLTLQLALHICSFASVDSSNHASCEKMWVQVNPQSSSLCCSRAKCISIELGLSTTTLLSGQQPNSLMLALRFIFMPFLTSSASSSGPIAPPSVSLHQLFSEHLPQFSYWAGTGNTKGQNHQFPAPTEFSHVYSPLLMTP